MEAVQPVCIRGSIYTDMYHQQVPLLSPLPDLGAEGGGGLWGVACWCCFAPWCAWDGREAEECLDSVQMVYKQCGAQLCHMQRNQGPPQPWSTQSAEDRKHLEKERQRGQKEGVRGGCDNYSGQGC